MKRGIVQVAFAAVVPWITIVCSAPAELSAARPGPSHAGGGSSPLVVEGTVDTSDTRMLAQPAVSADNVAFTYAGDLWVASRDGDAVRRLTSHPGGEARPRFSPDGSLVAFTGQYDGNPDVYVVPTAGGEPRRLTWHPDADIVQGFTPDGSRVLFTSPRSVYTRTFTRLYTVPVEGGHPDELPIPHAAKASYSPDGGKIAYTPLFEPFLQWKNYRGGTHTRIWIYDVADHSVRQIPQPEGRCNDSDPMWIGELVYFRSDRNGEFNLFSYDPDSEAVSQLTEHDDFPVLDASAGGGRIVYEQAGWLHLHEPGAGTTRLRIGVAADLIETRPRYVEGEEYIRAAGISPTGKRAVFGFRGEIITLPAEKGDPRSLTRTPGVHEREPAWSPDGRWIAYFSDASGQYELHVAPRDGRGEVRVFPPGGAGFYEDVAWSPDAKKICFTDNSWVYFVLDVESGEVVKIAQEPLYGPIRTMHHAWSPDSKWIAYTLNTSSYFKKIYLYDVESDTSHEITEGLSDASEPVFDEGGKYLYFSASTDAGPARTWFAMSNADVEVTNTLYLAVLSRDEPSPLARESDEEEVEDPEEATPEDSDSEESEPAPEGEEAEADEEGEEDGVDDDQLMGDVDGLARRIVALPVAGTFHSQLQPGAEGQLYYIRGEGSGPFGNLGAGALVRFDLGSRKETTLMAGAAGFDVSADRKKLLVVSPGGWLIADAGGPIDPSKGRLALDRLEVKIDPRSEWAQIFDEAWRINRDYFYDPGMHGADWPAMREKYAQFLPHLAVRSDLNRLIQWMCSELAVGHHGVGGGDTLIRADRISGGLLGADYEVANGRYRFAKVYGGLNWNPTLRAPLTEPGVDVTAGEYLLAVDGRDLAPPENLYSRFEKTAGKAVELTVGPNPDGTDSRTVKAVPIGSEAALRNRDWVEGNIRRVTEATDGRVAYVYVPNTSVLGHIYFKRYFFPQADRDAIIVDERHNGGGQIADYYIDILRRPYISHWAMRYGADLETPIGAIHGPKVMLIDETAGSGGDLLPWMFQELELGTLVGRPTWGGLVGVMGFPTLMDGGVVTAPNIGFWTEDGFTVENVGVPPDVEVEQLPALVIEGRDPQLEAAIRIALEQLAADPPKRYERPPFPIRARR